MINEAKITQEDLSTIKAIAKILMGMCPENDKVEELSLNIIGMVNDILKDWNLISDEKKIEALNMLQEGLKNLPGMSMRKMSVPPDLQQKMRDMKES